MMRVNIRSGTEAAPWRRGTKLLNILERLTRDIIFWIEKDKTANCLLSQNHESVRSSSERRC